MNIYLNGITLTNKQLDALVFKINENKDFLESIENGISTCFVFPLGIKQNIVGKYYFELSKYNGMLILDKAKIK